MNPFVHPDTKYLYIKLHNIDDSDKGKAFSVHNLVATYFIENEENYEIVDHINRNR
jgi:hypothetical protein